jgi:sporulation protein YlmC with PRC-barrel domain
MKASEFIGMKVLDKEANEVGKVAEIAVIFKKCLVDKIFISIGSALNKKYLVIMDDDIAEVGDYLQLKIDKEGIDEQIKVDKIDDFMGKGTKFKEFIGKTVLTINGMDVGKITDMMIDPKGCLIHNIVVTTGGTLNKKHILISDDDINAMGDYLILKLDQEQVKDRMTD